MNHDDLVRTTGSGLNIAADPDGLLRVPAEELRRVEHLTLGVGQGLTVLGGDQQRQLIDPIDHQLVGPLQDLRSLARSGLSPRLSGGGGSIDTGEGVVNTPAGHRGEDAARRGVQNVERGPV
jgi:hypothetical protein